MVAPHAAHAVAIVGGGAIGAALLRALVDRLSAEQTLRSKTRVVLYERDARIGPGLAYAKDDAPYVLNQSARTMSLVPGHRAHFCDWLEARGLGRAQSGDDLFCERRLFGDYVEDELARAHDKARRAGLAVTMVRDEVTSLTPKRSGYRVAPRSQAPTDADVVVLAVGNLPNAKFRHLEGHPGFVASPYPSAAMCARIPKDARVAIAGTGLSAIDAALALFAAGHEAPVTMVSRSGLLPAIRGPLPAHELHYATRANVARETDHGRRPLRWPTVLRWLEMEMQRHDASVSWEEDFAAFEPPIQRYESQVAAAKRGARTWQSVGEALNPMIEVLWHHLAEDDKRLFLDRFHSRFMSHWVPIPLVNGEKILALLRERRLTVARGLERVALDAGSFRLHFANQATTCDRFVNATGVPRHLADCHSPFVQSLVAQGILRAHEFGGVRVGFDSLRVLGKDDHPDPGLFALGNLTSGTHLFTSTLELNVEKADRIAAQIVSDLLRRSSAKERSLGDATPHST